MPLSGRARVNLAVTDVTPGSFLLRESAPGVSVDAVVTVAGAPLAVAMRTCPLPPRWWVFLHPERIGQEDAPPLREELQAPDELRLPVRPRLVRALRGAASPSYVTTDCAALDAPGVSARDLVRFSRWWTGSGDGRTSRGRSPSRLATVVRGQAGTVRVLGAWSGAMRPSGPALGAAW
jgi:hypothetical protein